VPISARIAVIQLSGKPINKNIVQVYASFGGTDDLR